MDSFKIFEKFSNERQNKKIEGSVWSAKNAIFRDIFDHEFRKAQQDLSSKHSRKSGNKHQHQGSEVEGSHRPLPVPGYGRDDAYSLRDSGLSRPALNQFRHILSSEIKTTTVKWSDLDKNAKLQNELLHSIDLGILIVTDIPQIPIEHETDQNFYGFDTEDNGWGMPHYHQFAWRDGVAFSYSFRLLFLWASREFDLNAGNHTIWCTNLEYDFGNMLKDWDIEADYLDVRWRRGKLSKAVFHYYPPQSKLANGWGREDYRRSSWKVQDTMNHWPLSVEKQGKILSKIMGFDFSKLQKDFYGLKYAAMDAIISRSYASMQAVEYQRRGIPLKLTPGAVAMEWYMKGETKDGVPFCRQRVYRTHQDDELDWLYPALKGGRTEVFSVAKHEGKIGYFDINSAYPYSMMSGTFPKLNPHWWAHGNKNIREFIEGDYEGVADCDVDASDVNELAQKIPYLGYIDDKTKRFIFPLGHFKGRYTFFEIRKAISLGYKFKFTKALCYERATVHPFKDYVEAAYALRLEGAATGNDVLKDIGKNLGNNLYGKWGQRSILTKLVDAAAYPDSVIENCKRIGKAAIIEEDDGYAIQTNVVWGAYITAMTRDLLYDHMIQALIHGNEVLYCDTDSIFITGGEWPESDKTKLGALKHEGDLSSFQSKLPKTYMYEKDGKVIYKSKGVPEAQRETFFVSGIVEYRKPIKLRENLARKNYKQEDGKAEITPGGVSAVNAWVRVKKELKGEYTKRKVLKNGSTVPHVVDLR
jgi:hypothetical protein